MSYTYDVHENCVIFKIPPPERTKSKQEQNQVTSHSNWPDVLLFDLAHNQCNSILKTWLHRLTQESTTGKFLVNNILILDSA